MTTVRRLLAVLLALVGAVGLSASSALGASGAERTVIVIGVDGLSGEMLGSVSTPNLERLRREGAWTQSLIPTFPAISQPSWTSISTGCWPEHHGVLTNKFFGRERGLVYHDWHSAWLLGCQHLHEVAEAQDVSVAALGWVGRFSQNGNSETTYVTHERSVPHDDFENPSDRERARQIIEHLQLPDEERPSLILAWFRGPDHVAHRTGAASEETREAVLAVDAAIGSVLAAIDELPFRERVVLAVVSDHGHVPVSRVVNVQGTLRRHGIGATIGPTGFLFLDSPSDADRTVEIFSGREEVNAFRRDDAPAWVHLGTSAAVGDVVVWTRPGYVVTDLGAAPSWVRWLASVGPELLPSTLLGRGLVSAHGSYPPNTPGVQGVLYLWGSGVVAEREINGFRTIDLHPTLADLLGIDPGNPVDGHRFDQVLIEHAGAR